MRRNDSPQHIRVVASSLIVAVLLMTVVIPTQRAQALSDVSIVVDDSLTSDTDGASPARQTSIDFWVVLPSSSAVHIGPQTGSIHLPSESSTARTSCVVRCSSPRAPPFSL